jgi:predicted transcriptional regulator
MYDETGSDGKRAYTVAQIDTEFGVTMPTIYRHLSKQVGHSGGSPAHSG